jgi:hypothetical protein
MPRRCGTFSKFVEEIPLIEREEFTDSNQDCKQ